MKNQVLELNSGSIEKFGIFRRPNWIFPSQLCEIKGQIEDNWEFNGQVRVKSHKSKTEDQNKRARKAKVAVKILIGIQSHKFKSSKLIEGAIRTITDSVMKLYFHLSKIIQACLHYSVTWTMQGTPLQVQRWQPIDACNGQSKGCLLPYKYPNHNMQ